jgi:hypothetical protein
MLAYPRASRGLQPRLKRLDVLMVLNVRIPQSMGFALLYPSYGASRGLDVLMVLKRENTSIDGFRAALPILLFAINLNLPIAMSGWR